MKNNKKINLIGLRASLVLYIVYVFCLFMLHPFVASAEEKLPGGEGNTVTVSSSRYQISTENKTVYNVTMIAADGYEIIGILDNARNSIGPLYKTIWFYQYNQSTGEYKVIEKNGLNDYVGAQLNYKKGDLASSSALTISNIISSFDYSNIAQEDYVITCSVSGCKIFSSYDAAKAYAKDGSLDGMLKDETDKSWYLKDIKCDVTADDSPTSEAGEDATYIKFFWLTDNLEEGDLLEIKTHNYLKKIGGDQISGFHNYITWSNNVSAYDDVFTDENGDERASYTLSQYDATKAWFQTLDNKPLIFKSYDTDIYYFRPYRNGVAGGWVKVTMNRNPLIKGSPYIEDVEVGDFDEDDEWVTDEKLTEENGGHHGVDQNGNIFYPDASNPFEGTNVAGIFSWFFDFFKDIPSLLGDLPSLVGQVVGFLPVQIIGFIGLGIVVAIILRIVGR